MDKQAVVAKESVFLVQVKFPLNFPPFPSAPGPFEEKGIEGACGTILKTNRTVDPFNLFVFGGYNPIAGLQNWANFQLYITPSSLNSSQVAVSFGSWAINYTRTGATSIFNPTSIGSGTIYIYGGLDMPSNSYFTNITVYTLTAGTVSWPNFVQLY